MEESDKRLRQTKWWRQEKIKQKETEIDEYGQTNKKTKQRHRGKLKDIKNQREKKSDRQKKTTDDNNQGGE